MNTDLPIAPLLDLLLKSAALTLLGTALLAALRRTSAANRHAVSLGIFAALLLLPFTKLMPSRWSLALEKRPEPAVSVHLPLIATMRAADPHVSPPPMEMSANPVQRAPLVIPWKALALSLWLGGVALLLARRALIALRWHAVVRRSEAIEDERLALMANDLVKGSGTRAEVRESALCRVPIVAGIARPVVLLPIEAKDWSDALISSALRHELGHIRRRDCITRLLADVVCALYWLNPLVWFAARQMRLAQEQACDDLVLNSGARAEEYAGQLVEVVRSLSGDRFTARHALAMAQPSTLETRVRAIVDATRDRSPRSVRGASASVAFVATALALCTAAQLRGAEGEKPVPATEAVDADAPQVMIEAKFIDFSGKVEDLPELLQQAVGLKKPGVAAIATANAGNDALKALGRIGGADVLSAPRVTTRSNQRATVKVGSEFKYATEWDKDVKAGQWKPKTFDTKNVGVNFEVTPKVNADGTIALHMIPEIVEVAGFVDLDGTKGEHIPEGHRIQTIFDTRKIDALVTVKAGDTVVLGGVERDSLDALEQKNTGTGSVMFMERVQKSRLIVLVTASIVAEEGKKTGDAPADAAGKSGAATAPKPLEIQSDSVTFDPKIGIISASGRVKIKTAEAVITADAAQVTPKKVAPEITFPKVEFRDATLSECVDFLNGKGGNIVLRNADKVGDAKITLSLSNVPIAEVLKYVAALSGCEVVKDEFAYVIQPAGDAAK